jgi:hypothetical protein
VLSQTADKEVSEEEMIGCCRCGIRCGYGEDQGTDFDILLSIIIYFGGGQNLEVVLFNIWSLTG